MTEHPSADTLADLTEGLLDDAQARTAEEHLQGCPRCASQRAALQRLPAVLAAAADTGPMPEDVAARVDVALAAQARRSTATGAVDVTPLHTPSRAPWGMRVLQAAAVLVLLLAGVGLAVTAVDRGSSDENAASGGGGSNDSVAEEKAVADYPVSASGRDWEQETLVDAVPGLIAGSVALTAPQSSLGAQSESGADAGGAPQDRVARELAGNAAAPLADGPVLADCLGRLGLGPTPLAVDIARWQGRPAAVIVLPAAEDPATVEVYVLEPTCPKGGVLFFASRPRP